MINEFSKLIDNHIHIIRASVTFIGFAGVAIFSKKSHLFKIYNNAAEIPSEFISKQRQLRGVVKNIHESGKIQIQHQATLLPKFFTQKGKHLEILLAGTHPRNGWLSFLTTQLLHKPVHFVILKREGNLLYSVLYQKKGIFMRKCVNEEVVKNGVAVVSELHTTEKLNVSSQAFLCNLVKLEVIADARGKGVWKKNSMKEKILNYLRRKRTG
ncbi:protein C3orf33 homolog isoform X2 [Hydractinia symbiolongicarpus]|uniref:protein C3orf33 homolog isoform X2 n=1 Tax=Hydractinia symbiolongicarpus TaxID=13093 RepID=UPI0025513677|nr:protein C3orf33 homolog isoform X2 [Hydractinia symbiolongicarpus]